LMRAVFLVAIQRGMSSIFGFRCCVDFRDRLSLSELSLFVFYFPLLAAGSFRCYRLCSGLVVMLVTGSMAGRAMAELRWAAGC
jgi:hypothetical protein